MAKITTVIDIGSNSMRMVVFKKTSRFGFHLINETKSKVKISQGCYENNNKLQFKPMARAFEALKSFLIIAKSLKSRKILCVATSALRDAPNKKEFLLKVSKKLKLNIKIIDGQKEAYYGGISALNLLPNNTFTTLDIGGGSCEFAFVKNKKIINTFSLQIGTVRLKELYFNNNNLTGAKNYIYKQLKQINQIQIDSIVALGGTARALSRIILKNTNYPLDILHGFCYEPQKHFDLFDSIIKATSTKKLKKLGVEKDRYDTIKVGAFIFKTIIEFFSVTNITTSGVGVREGVYLTDILRNSNHRFPSNFNVSVRSLLDRFVDDVKQSAYLGNNAKKIFDILASLHNLDEKYRSILVIASKLQLIGLSLNFDKNEEHSFWYILNGLEYGFTHNDKILIALVIKFTKKTLLQQKDIKRYKKLLPSLYIVQWLNFMMNLNVALNSEFDKIVYNYTLNNNILKIGATSTKYIVQKAVLKLKAPIDLKIVFNENLYS
jgi:exopolyphosphatase/guanosine-5'-triphosphate,3'-diphosphate pyrophosphatase